MTMLPKYPKTQHQLRALKREARDNLDRLHKIKFQVEIAMKSQQDQLDALGDLDSSLDQNAATNQGIVDGLDSQLDANVQTIADLEASNDRTSEVDAVAAIKAKIAPVTTTHPTPPTP